MIRDKLFLAVLRKLGILVNTMQFNIVHNRAWKLNKNASINTRSWTPPTMLHNQ